MKVDVADFLDLDDSALSPDGRNGAMWEFHDFDEFEEAEEPTLALNATACRQWSFAPVSPMAWDIAVQFTGRGEGG